MDSCSTIMHPCPLSPIAAHSDNYSCSTSPCSVSSTSSKVNYEEISDVSSTISSEEINIFNKDTDEEAEIPGQTLKPYQYKPVETSDTEQSDCGDELSSDEELKGIGYELVAQVSLVLLLTKICYGCHCGYCKMMPTREKCICCCSISEVVSKLEEVGASCITESEGFNAVCTNGFCRLLIISTSNSTGGILNLHTSMFEVAYMRMFLLYNFMCGTLGNTDAQAIVN